MRTSPLDGWLAGHPAVRVAPYWHAESFGGLFTHATNGADSIAAMPAVGLQHLAGGIINAT